MTDVELEAQPPSRAHGRSNFVVGWFRARPLLTVFVVALSVRVAAAIVFSALDLAPESSETLFWEMAGDVMRGDVDFEGYSEAAYRNAAGVVWLTAAIRWLTDSSLLAARLIMTLFGAATAVAAAVVAGRIWGARMRVAAGLVVALWPSQIAYSSAVLKDPPAWAGTAALGAIILMLPDARPRRKIVFALAGAAVLILMTQFRISTAVIAAWAAVPAVWFIVRENRILATVVTLILALAVPVVRPPVPGLSRHVDAGVGGSRHVDAGVGGSELLKGARDTAEGRAVSAEGGCTTFIAQRELSGRSDLVLKIMDGVRAVLVEPVPWRKVCSQWGALSKAGMAVWYTMLGAAVFGLYVARRRWRTIVYPIVFAGGLTLAMAIAEANIGTMYRHRGQLVWVVSVLAVGVLVRLRGSAPSSTDP